MKDIFRAICIQKGRRISPSFNACVKLLNLCSGSFFGGELCAYDREGRCGIIVTELVENQNRKRTPPLEIYACDTCKVNNDINSVFRCRLVFSLYFIERFDNDVFGFNTGNSHSKRLHIGKGCARNVDVLLAPGLNIKRNPHCGRSFEYFSEDPHVCGELAYQYVKGLQDNHIGATIKHYCCNNTEFSRMWLSSEVDERTLREIYLKAFETACKAEPSAVMCSYNVVNGVRMAQHGKLFKLLRNEFGFGDGLIMSDWGAVTNADQSVKAGLDLIMPYCDKHEETLRQAYEKGELTEKQIDECAERVLKFVDRCEKQSKLRKVTVSKEKRLELARRIEAEGAVLLKNNGVLPIRQGASVSMSGNYANTYIHGGGSSRIICDGQPITLLAALKNALPQSEVTYRDLWEYGVSEAPVLQVDDAYGKDVAIVCAGLFDQEDTDRAHARLPKSQERIIREVSRKNPNTVVVLYCGAPIDMSDWIDDVSAVVWAGYPGQTGNLAIADILTGKINPCGKLTETFPLTEYAYPAHDTYCDSAVSLYSDGLLVGYRYHVTAKHNGLPNALPQPRFPFGFGLSYSHYVYSNASAKVNADNSVDVEFDVTNTSETDGVEIAQIYVREVSPKVFRPYMELKGFERVNVAAGATVRVKATLNGDAFAYYSVSEDRWLIEGGAYELLIGTNSADTPLCLPITLKRQ